MDDSNFDLAYGEVIRLFGAGPHLWLDLFQVKVAGIDNLIVKEVLAIQRKYPSKIVTRLRNFMLGGVFVDEICIYPLPVPVAG